MPELVWKGKYDSTGHRVAPVRTALPFQTVETFNASAQERQRIRDRARTERHPEWRNRLIWGDATYVLPSLLPEFAGNVDLVYIDPPFATGHDFSLDAVLPGAGEMGFKELSSIERNAYSDTWAHGLDGYLYWFSAAASLLFDLLAPHGSLWVQLDWRAGYHAKCILDEIFPAGAFRNDIVWSYGGSGRGAKAIAGQFPRNHDLLLWYTKSSTYTYTPQYTQRRVPLEAAGKAGFRRDGDGRWFKTAPRGDYTDASIEALERAGRVHRTRTGGVRIKYFLRQEGQDVVEDVLLGDTWSDIADAMHLPEAERTGYPTQKPQPLLERIIRTASKENDLVLDCSAGSGTAAAAAERLNRRWIAADRSHLAIHTTRKRLLSIPAVRPFILQTLGTQERQAWQSAEFGDQGQERYRRFLLNLYGAEPLSGSTWLHGRKNGHLVHIGAVDAPVCAEDIRQIALDYERAMNAGTAAPEMSRVDVLGWDFAVERNELAGQQTALASIDVHFIHIPREVLDSNAVEQGDVCFCELAGLDVEARVQGAEVTVTLTGFTMPLDGVPLDVYRAVTHWSQWIDYWAVDWDTRSDTFHTGCQTYRTRAAPELLTTSRHTYGEPGIYRIMVKAVDILGNDTTRTLPVEII